MMSVTVTVPTVGAAVGPARFDTPMNQVAVDPRENGVGTWFLVIVRSGAITDVGVDAELFAGTGSCDVEVTVAVLLIVPEADVMTKSVTVAVSPGAIVPSAHVTVLEPEQEPWDGVEETKLVPAGRTSVTLAPVAVAGPLFVTTIVYRTFEPA